MTKKVGWFLIVNAVLLVWAGIGIALASWNVGDVESGRLGMTAFSSVVLGLILGFAGLVCFDEAK